MRRSHPGPLTSAQVREGRRRALLPASPLWAPTRTFTGPGKAGDPAVWARAALGVPAPRSRRGAAPPPVSGACLPAPRRLLSGIPPPALPEAVERETEGAPGRSEGSAGGAGRCPPASAWVTPPCPPLLWQGSSEAAGRRAAPPGQALAALKSRPLLIRQWQGSNFAPRLMPALRPQNWAESFLYR